jgi:hypothetical protein
MKTYGGVNVYFHIFLISALAGVDWSASRPDSFSPGKEPPIRIGQEVGWTPEPVSTTWRRGNSLPYRDSNSDPSVAQPVASRNTYYAKPYGFQDN